MVAQSITELHTIKSPITLDNFATTKVDNKDIYMLSTNSDSVLLDDVTRWYSSPWPSPTKIQTYFTVVNSDQQFLIEARIASKGSIYTPQFTIDIDSNYLLIFTYYGDTLKINESIFVNNNGGFGALCVTKIKKDGSIAFCKSFSGYPANSQIASLPDGKIVISGTTNQGKMIFDGQVLLPFGMGSVSDSDVFVAVLDSMGQVLHVKRFGGDTYDYCLSLVTTDDGSIYLSGDIYSYQFHIDSLTLMTDGGGGKFGHSDGLLLKLDSTLQPLWYKHAVGFGSQRGLLVEADNAGKIYWALEFSNYESYLDGETLHGALDNCMVYQLDTEGNINWQKQFGTPNGSYITSMSFDPDNNLWLATTYEDSLQFGATTLMGQGNTDNALVKMSPEGDFLRWFNVAGPSFQRITGVQAIGNHQLFVVGVTDSLTFLNLHIQQEEEYHNTFFHFIIDLDAVGTQEPLLESIQFSTFPNPVPMGGQVQIQLQSPVRQGQINLYNALGQSVAQAAIPDQATKISFVAPRQAGLYYLTVSAGRQSTTQKIVVGQ